MKQGIFYAVAAYFAWGLLPLYWKLFQSMGAWEILAHRIVWSVLFVAIIIQVTKRWKTMWGSVTGGKMFAALAICSLLISANWLIYIWAVNNNQIMQTSLGYYMNPLFTVLLGVIFLKEKMHAGQWVALILAACGVLFVTFQYGEVPWIALSLAVTFAFYGLAKKLVKQEAMIGLAWETLFVAPIALGYLLMLQANGTETIATLAWWQMLLLALAGVATAMPLYWFAQAAVRLPLSIVGFIQYLSPTISLLTAVFLYKEPFTTTHLISFACIWSALIIFTASSMRKKPAAAPIKQEVAIKKQA
ncbi:MULTISPECIES: EamA family transporter RarD [Brevibacillus]|uniref:EamA family transporter RarD n=1 Tax=Brevibacillus TaxID=55080 RepID=UPI000EEC3630|nr:MULTISPECIES: EamA family transporter RarD [Brevibacillus]MED2254365.1 EamA family transporter RarD [Brevibacillus parabrevis]UED67308.1 EamA family transporter RarD [Brevibacillus sp. HD3.3A]HBZ78928.1 EamA family transporter RarD [Brevibacillus sp.]